MMTTEERFWSKVDRSGGPDSCWPWLAGRMRAGYGNFWMDGHEKLAHRVAWELTNGPIPIGLCVLHRCDNAPCQNPIHLWLGTKADNSRDMVSKGRHTSRQKTQCPAGHLYDAANTYVDPRGLRYCRACRRIRALAAYHRSRQAA